VNGMGEMAKARTRRLVAVGLALIYSGFAAAAAVGPLVCQAHVCCAAKHAPVPHCPMGNCLSDGATSSAPILVPPALLATLVSPVLSLPSAERGGGARKPAARG